MRTRPALAIALAASVVLGGAVASAAPKVKPVCNLLVDAKDDAKGFLVTEPGPVPVSDPNLDILSADLATDAKKITAVIRLAAMDATDPMSPGGHAFYLNFSVNGVPFYLNADNDATLGRSFSVGGFDAEGFRASFGEASGVFDVMKKEIRITAPLSALTGAGKVKPGATIDGIEALAQRLAVVLTPSADDAVASATYKAQAPSCVAVGK